MVSVTGHMETIMAGLCCGVPSVQVSPHHMIMIMMP